MPDIAHAREPRLLALDQLLSHRSVGLLQEPAPTDADLNLIIDAGLRAPDHGRVRPWRFVVIRGDARLAYAEKLAEAAVLRDPVRRAPASRSARMSSICSRPIDRRT
jgi:nitroreductase